MAEALTQIVIKTRVWTEQNPIFEHTDVRKNIYPIVISPPFKIHNQHSNKKRSFENKQEGRK